VTGGVPARGFRAGGRPRLPGAGIIPKARRKEFSKFGNGARRRAAGRDACASRVSLEAAFGSVA